MSSAQPKVSLPLVSTYCLKYPTKSRREILKGVAAPQAYQRDLFEEVCEDDELVILARGLGLLRIVTSLLHKYDAVGNNLVLLIGADERENGWLGEGWIPVDNSRGLVGMEG